MKIVLSHFKGDHEVEQQTVSGPEEAGRRLAELNAVAAKGWSWRLAESNFVGDDGCPLSIDEANAIRRSCGQQEY